MAKWGYESEKADRRKKHGTDAKIFENEMIKFWRHTDEFNRADGDRQGYTGWVQGPVQPQTR